MPKSINYDNIVKEMVKGNLDQQIEVFQRIKDFVTDEIIKEASKHEERQNQLLRIKDKLSQIKDDK